MIRGGDPVSTVRVASWGWLLAGLLLGARGEAAVCAGLIFADDFERGDTSLWDNSPDPARVDGTWIFSLDFGGTLRPFTLELIERPDGALVGYLLGGTFRRVLIGGAVTAGTVTLELELDRPGSTRTITLSGPVGRKSIAAEVSGDIAPQATALARVGCELFEQLLATAALSGPEPEHVRVLAVVRDGAGAFAAGGFVGLDDCDLWACDGGLTSFAEAGDVLSAGLETDGGCSAGSTFTVTWTGDGFYAGSYSFTDCLGTSSGDIIAATSMGTSTAELRALLAPRFALSAALEAGAPLPTPLPGLSPSYLHFGKDEAALRAELADDQSRYGSIRVELTRVRDVFTRVHPRALPNLIQPFGAWLAERRSGVPQPGPGPPVTYRDTHARPVIDDLGAVAVEAGTWVIAGNQVGGLDLPFASTLEPGTGRLVAPTPAGPVWVSIGPYGAHFPPLTGDPSGEAKANFVGYLAEDDGDMEELVGNGDGIRQPGEVWGFPVGGDPTGNAVRWRRPPFIAPADGEVGSLVYTTGPSPIHFDHEPQWKLELALPGGVRYAIGHLGRVAPALRAQVIAVTGIDPDTFAGPVGTDLLAGQPPIPVVAGAELALPQLIADPVPGFPGYWAGGGSFFTWPWAQVEFQVPFHLGGDQGADFCVYRFFTGQRRAELQAAMTVDMLDPASQRYQDGPFHHRWQWTAQGSLCQAENPLPRDFSDLYTRLGGWTERVAPGTTVDEMFAFVPIDRDSGVYDPGNYDSPAVEHLVIRNRQPDPYQWTMPDGATIPVFYPVGEVLERTDDAMLVKWRDLHPGYPVVYQRLAYRLDADGLTIEWGNFASTPAAAVPPTLLPGEPCDDTSVLCYDHAIGAWPP